MILMILTVSTRMPVVDLTTNQSKVIVIEIADNDEKDISYRLVPLLSFGTFGSVDVRNYRSASCPVSRDATG